MRYTEKVVCQNCEETLHIDLEEPVQTRQDLWVYGETRVEYFEDHVRISLDDWNKYKQRLIPVLKQGDRKHATGNSETKEASSQHACG